MQFLFLFLFIALAIANKPTSKKNTYVTTPVGRILSECVHNVPSGSVIEEERDENDLITGRRIVRKNNHVVEIVPRCDTTEFPFFETISPSDDPPFPPDYDGWLVYTAFNTSSGFDTFLGDFTVPDAPASPPDVLFLFTGLQNIDWVPKRDPNPDGFDIIQPVLQYPGDDGYYWSVKSWYVTLDAGAFSSEEVMVSPGDTIFGNMSRITGEDWFIGSTALSTGQTTNMTYEAARLKDQFWAYNTLECYGCVDCSTYPSKNPSVFTNLALTKNSAPVVADWKINPKPNPTRFCTETITVQSPTGVTITF